MRTPPRIVRRSRRGGRAPDFARWSAIGLALIATTSLASADDAPPAPRPAPASSAPAAEDPAIGLMRKRLTGTWRDSASAANTANRDAGVETSVRSLFVMFRSIARSRLVEGNPVFPTVRVAFSDGDIDVRTGSLVARSPESGAERAIVGLDRAQNRLTQSVTAKGLVQTTWNDAGSRTTRFVPSADGRSLTLHVQITSPRLPVPVTYTMAYTRGEE